MASMSHGPRTLPRKPGTASIPMPLVLTQDTLTEFIHSHLWQCVHPADEKLAPQCEVLAEQLMESGVVKEAGDFVRSLGTHSGVQETILNAMAEAWQEGAHAQDGEDNPYG